LVELGCGGQSGGAAADDCDALSRAVRWRAGHDPTFGKAAVDDCVFDVFDCHGRVGNAQYAGAFAWSRACATGEFRKIIGFVQSIEGISPTALINQIVPFGNEIVDRTAGVRLAKRHAAVHAPRALGAQLFLGRIGIDLQEVASPGERISIGDGLARVVFESGRFAHGIEISWL